MKRTVVILLLLTAVGIGAVWWWNHRKPPATQLTLYGNVDLRQVELAFNNSERIAAVLVQEGDHVRAGQVLAKLDTGRLEPQVAQAEATAAAQRNVVERLHNGNRPEEIAQARANLEAAKADAANARLQYDRMRSLAPKGAASQQQFDDAKASLDVADAKQAMNQKALDLQLLGPRKEEIAENEARLKANEAQLAFLQQQLKDAQLIAPMDAVVRTRIMEPGEMASPQKPVFSLAIIDPKWVRAYVNERDLGHVHQGMVATVAVDSFPDRSFDGWVGFISPTAEFTPKPVETTELRTSLVYEVRVFVKDATDDLRLGMPATVQVALDQAGKAGAATNSRQEAGGTRQDDGADETASGRGWTEGKPRSQPNDEVSPPSAESKR
ncbi:MAG TPA: efflux RND transporter periplasmic adaptor subunit [Pirellulales bacterium]|jgi:HlyD family secretion protein|nr:efflux RND transporter periplasmic adaptor subunit [Pirellulales bacterium]